MNVITDYLKMKIFFIVCYPGFLPIVRQRSILLPNLIKLKITIFIVRFPPGLVVWFLVASLDTDVDRMFPIKLETLFIIIFLVLITICILINYR